MIKWFGYKGYFWFIDESINRLIIHFSINYLIFKKLQIQMKWWWFRYVIRQVIEKLNIVADPGLKAYHEGKHLGPSLTPGPEAAGHKQLRMGLGDNKPLGNRKRNELLKAARVRTGPVEV